MSTKPDPCTQLLNATLSDELHGDMLLSAKSAKLRYMQDSSPGLGRKRAAKGFRYIDSEGKPVRDADVLARIKALAIPPAWREVWICPHAHGHLQATGIDARGRKQYRYHAKWRKVRDQAKFEHMVDFALHLPLIRERVAQDLARPGLNMHKVLALVVALLEQTMIRVGNDEYARSNQSFGLTTLRNRHVDIKGGSLVFHFKGKSRVEHAIELQNARLARLVRRIKELPGQALFQYLDEDGQRHAVSSTEVNDYLKEISGRDYSAKDFRTWSGTVHTFMALSACEPSANDSEAKKNVMAAVTAAARKLGNTPTICRKCYVHPAIIETYLLGKAFAAGTGEDEREQLALAEKKVLELLQGYKV
ncbi:DNA topoisomerase IB [Methylobacillus glycogenes]|uniref:DNA topoisomerase IB n=1 Tax=Methylobacillus glycogenes TaxID=406 RepID=UPI000470230C|nr:DNA topoisomerase IB [Methylobacillus glycogenes]